MERSDERIALGYCKTHFDSDQILSTHTRTPRAESRPEWPQSGTSRTGHARPEIEVNHARYVRSPRAVARGFDVMVLGKVGDGLAHGALISAYNRATEPDYATGGLIPALSRAERQGRSMREKPA